METSIISAGQKQGPDTSLSVFSNERYLLAYDLSDVKQEFRWWLLNWKKIFAASALGVCVGLGGAAFQMTGAGPAQEIVRVQPANESKPPATVMSTPRPEEKSSAAMVKTSELAPALSKEEAARLKARNRRLEALISVLRQRAHAPEKRPAQDQTSYLGQ